MPITIKTPSRELWDEKNECFLDVKEQKLRLEHSLVSLSKWESIHHKPFLTKTEKTTNETIDYIRCMNITQNVDPLVFYSLSNENITQIRKYIEDPMTATTVPDNNHGKLNGEQVTSELVYYWMIKLGIPFECEKWHLNRLLILIRVCSYKDQPKKKSSQSQLRSHFASVNAKRRPKKG